LPALFGRGFLRRGPSKKTIRGDRRCFARRFPDPCSGQYRRRVSVASRLASPPPEGPEVLLRFLLLNAQRISPTPVSRLSADGSFLARIIITDREDERPLLEIVARAFRTRTVPTTFAHSAPEMVAGGARGRFFGRRPLRISCFHDNIPIPVDGRICAAACRLTRSPVDLKIVLIGTGLICRIATQARIPRLAVWGLDKLFLGSPRSRAKNKKPSSISFLKPFFSFGNMRGRW